LFQVCPATAGIASIPTAVAQAAAFRIVDPLRQLPLF
jgi:hypothetical protein